MKNESISWSTLTNLTRGEPIEVERVRIKANGITLEGRFELPALVQMSEEDQVFISAFLRSHGSIKEMERLFGISYPTVKARLARIAEQLPFVETVQGSSNGGDSNLRKHTDRDVLERLERGDIDSAEAIKLLQKQRRDG